MRGLIIGAAAACFAAAAIIVAAAARLPAPPRPAISSRPATAAVEAPAPQTPETPPTIAGDTTAVSPPGPSPNETYVSEDDTLLELADRSQRAGDLKKAETIYLFLLRKEGYRSEAAQRLGKLYFNAGDYSRAGEMYRESARVLRESTRATP